ncbi:MAG: mycofactocin biosynthesis chaperone MftB [Pelotomaculum sp.]|uniref:Coenzyme PQQ synthesis protein D n=1 Tax=Pelotomaculum thermopropionicum (strain DSM 13744 / JCM 10971 / SI) TaxID=370438 RepID=A5D4R5_PELTS|nr:mycofactocin biosynthesis chaperone MftB [Pelotomaculum sp.]BAF58774.1 hypothetical protein PTH_0593 [Pelotomaculum thermopropionicum SI]
MKPDSRYALRAGTRFRHEDFGGIVYQRDADRLHIIRSRLAVRLLTLAGTGTVNEIAAGLAAGSSNEKAVRDRVLEALCRLEELGIIYEIQHLDNAAEGAGMPDLADHRQV